MVWLKQNKAFALKSAHVPSQYFGVYLNTQKTKSNLSFQNSAKTITNEMIKIKCCFFCSLSVKKPDARSKNTLELDSLAKHIKTV